MGWFDEQIEDRKKRERELLSDSFESIARSVTGQKVAVGIKDGADASDAIAQILKHFGVKEKETPSKLDSFEEKVDFLLSGTGILYRRIELSPGWRGDSFGALITTKKDSGAVITLLPSKLGGYEYIDPQNGNTIKITGKEEKNLEKEAMMFYRPLPQKKLTIKDLFKYMALSLTTWDYVSFGLAALIITLVGLLIPKLNHLLMGTVVETSNKTLLFAVMSFLFFVTLGNLVLAVVKSLTLSRINTKMNTGVRAAAMMRVLSLPATFFRDYSAGELNQYLSYLNSLCATITDAVLSTGVTGIFSLIYLTQIFAYAKSLVVPSLLITAATLIVSVLSAFMQTSFNKQIMTVTAKERGVVYSLISGIQKIRLAGAEDRAFSKWAKEYAKESDLVYNSPIFIKMSSVITTAISLIGTAVMYYSAVKNSVTVADYYAFNSSYAYISSAFTAIAAVAVTVANIKPGLEVLRPFLDAEPEIIKGLETVTKLSGNIELSHVSFKYEENGPEIIKDLSLNIPSKQYVAIVGKSGCGKSTLIRLLLGFETPTKGAIYYDKKDTRALDMASVRRQIGTVMQDGRLFGGSVYENITISAPTLSLTEAWNAASVSGIADDIKNMPMGMSTVLQEGFGGISGGQRQRLIIARAIAPKPKILIFDEATSALDNITQKRVSEALDEMNCTRIVIAHRLSTIRHCDRIIVLDGGKIIEDGTYDSLIEQNGFFAELVERQRLDK